jgi:spermidine synthase
VGARAALVVAGFSAVIAQIVLMRELIQVFNGNEISLGVLLATWLLWTAAGSALASIFGWGRGRTAVAVLACVLAASLPAAIWALRCSKSFFAAVPGELVGPVPMLAASLVCLSVFCIAAGALFVAAARMNEREANCGARAAAGTAYLAEAAGAAVGGVLASMVLVRCFAAFQIASLVGIVDLTLAAAVGLRLRAKPAMLAALAAALVAIPTTAWLAPRWEAAARARLWRGFTVVGERNSIYGNLIVTQTGGGDGSSPKSPQDGVLRSLYENGSILANAPDPAAAEEAVDYALLEHAAPRRVLLIGGGVNGAVAEALKHPTVERLDYVELDPALVALAREFFPAQTAAIDRDPRVRLHLLDGRRYLSETGERFDAIVVDVPDPQTAQLNRFYTVEFFRLAREHLAESGLVAVELRSSEETIDPDLAAFMRSIRRTMGEVFPYQAAIPGETIHFFGAAEPGVLTADPQVLVARLRERQLATQYVREYFIPYRMSADRMEQVETELAPTPATPVNRDFAPVAYGFDVVLWNAQFHSGYAEWFRRAEHLSLGRVAGGLALVLLVGVGGLAVLPGRERRKRAAAGACVAATGFTLMALQIFLLLGFQAVYGYVYTELAILIGLTMAGMALGSWLALGQMNGQDRIFLNSALCSKLFGHQNNRSANSLVSGQIQGFVSGHDLRDCGTTQTETHEVSGHDFSRAVTGAEETGALAPGAKLNLTAVQLLLALAAPALLAVISGMAGAHMAAWIAAGAIFPALAAAVGALGGYQFVAAAGNFVRDGEKRSGLGALYAIDLAGGCVGALALSGFLIPVYGFWPTAWIAAGINAAATFVSANQGNRQN